MLSRLSVTNLAIVENAEAEFACGLNVITGETGAGKSILMGALELVLGSRADSSIVRDGANQARVEAEFAIDAKSVPGREVAAILSETGLPACEDGVLLVRRVISATAQSKVWVNDAATTVATLKRLGASLVDIHGPRANQAILEERFQRDTLDRTLADKKALADYQAQYAIHEGLENELDRISKDSAADEVDVLQFQIGEIEAAGLTEEDETIAERHAAAANAGDLVENSNAVTEALGGDEGAAEKLLAIRPRLIEMARHLPEAGDWLAETEDLTVRIQELSRSVADRTSKLDLGEEDLVELDRRLTVVNKLKRKYGGAVAEILEVLAAKRARLAELEDRDAIIVRLEAKLADSKKVLSNLADKLTKARTAAAEKLARAVTKELRDLGFLQAKFSVRIEPISPASHGADKIDYMFEPNPGESARTLAQIASSGETARVMLAVKSVLAAHDSSATLVFDEIDANIGGEVGEIVGMKMRAVAKHRQVIAITHLPQSAVFGNRHLVVSKSVADGRTRTKISEVEGSARVSEIARMLGGEKLTSVVKKHAEELLSIPR